MLLRFGEAIEAEPGKKLFGIRQIGSMAEYVSEFEDLSAQVVGLSDKNLTRDERGELCKKEKKEVKPSGYTPIRSSSHYNTLRQSGLGNSTYRNTNITPRSQEQKNTEHTTNPNNLRLRKIYMDAELDAMMRDGICFKCKGKYYKGHPCTKKEWRVMTFINGCEVEVREQEWMDNREEELNLA
ncbi:unnamed protein product [Cochlearia groenlandica]